ncbi:ISL3 family transposase [Deinococcus yavapaiensis]|uniref:Transposase n=1 Tax=Deinococcus yavapaiensis KR-236 TaxID=694435 RepID=A0A318SJ93_9DEIO|nr:transposase [Deinococcus yavapaiensis KR-236]
MSLDLHTLFPPELDLQLVEVEQGNAALTLTLASRRRACVCPSCGTVSFRLHSRSTRFVQDLPCLGVTVSLRLIVRRFRCHHVPCTKQTFTEAFPEFITPFKRITKRLSSVFERVALDVGAEPGSRLLTSTGLFVSPDRLLRLVHALPRPERPCPNLIGIDDFAFRKGFTYGTVIVDLKTGTPVDLLSDRDASTVTTWLQARPNIELVARDRGKEYFVAVTTGAPQARQVLDRWHVLKNLREAVERQRAREQQAISNVLIQAGLQLPQIRRSRIDHVRRDAYTERRRAQYHKIRTLQSEGMTISGIARTLGIARPTVHAAVRTEHPPGVSRRRKRPSPLDVFEPHLRRRWAEGCRNAKLLWRELQALGYAGKYPPVRRWTEPRRGFDENVLPESNLIRGGSAPLAWYFVKPRTELDVDERRVLDVILTTFPALNELRTLTRTFVCALLDAKPADLASWRAKVEGSGLKSLQAFVLGLRHEWDALVAASETNGRTARPRAS